MLIAAASAVAVVLRLIPTCQGVEAAGDVCYIGIQRASVSANFDRGGDFVFIAETGGRKGNPKISKCQAL